MDLPLNRFKRAPREGRQQIGIGCSPPGGILTPDQAFARRCIALGTRLTAVGTDGGLLWRGADALRADFPGAPA